MKGNKDALWLIQVNMLVGPIVIAKRKEGLFVKYRPQEIQQQYNLQPFLPHKHVLKKHLKMDGFNFLKTKEEQTNFAITLMIILTYGSIGLGHMTLASKKEVDWRQYLRNRKIIL